LLEEVQKLTERLNNRLDFVHMVLLRAKVHAGLGRLLEAEAAFNQARQALLSRGIAYNAALVSLEMAVLLLKQGRSAEVRALVAELLPVLKAQKVTRETLAALDLFFKAVQQDTVTVEIASQCLRDLRRARGAEEGRPEKAAP
jgi:hypothetical protein